MMLRLRQDRDFGVTRPRQDRDTGVMRLRRQCHQFETRRSKQRLETFGRDVQAVTSH